MTHRHECVYRISVHCTRGNGKPRRKACAHCGGTLATMAGLWGVFAWRGDGRYPADGAVRTFTSEARADRYAAETSPDYVVRWIYA